jgi:hypothetical protein
MPLTSRFVYERSIVRDVASVFSSIRVSVPHDHYPTVDRLIREMTEMFYEHDPSFDVEDFCARAGYYRDRGDDHGR